ncbi:glycosyltransferase family 4 protein [Halovulum dunhuangense]|uniref:Glycosyltransferase family 4 protein n=1 Tax=Halovulum dunhuangense TaxID=1505036 RepID=A0A849KZB8_9RHOB|nr:glycosyltransferase family 4 protein [Halovulum dunhuangense]NNU79452.1 glycosyltransferase family 4 protein [Halovulum dunhuangense]
MKLAFAVPGRITTRTGGTLYDLHLIRALEALGHSVHLLELGDGWPHPDAGTMQAAIDRLAALDHATPVIVDGLAYGAFQTEALAGVKAPMTALVHHPLALEAGLPADLAARMAAREKANLALARQVLVPSPHTAAVLRAEYGTAADRVTIALPGFSLPAPSHTPRATPPLILSVGILCARKGHDVLLDALARIADLDWQAAIIGRPHEAAVVAALPRLRADLGLDDRVRILGEVPDETLAEHYRSASLFALATRYEGYGMVFGEALGHSLPIVSCRGGAVPDTVPAGAGILVDVDDAAAFARALRRILVDDALRHECATAARAAAEALPSWADTARLVADRLAAAR